LLPHKHIWLAAIGLLAAFGAIAETDFSGAIALEGRHFLREPLDTRQHGSNLSLSLEPELYWSSENGRQLISFVPFARLDQGDDKRTHVDIRELAWIVAGESLELRAGIRRVFWGVTESAHLVDIINQTDVVENVDGEDKLGQPMINLAWIGDAGTLDLFVLPGFRERTFPGKEGRLRSQPHIESDLVSYESDDEEQHIDYALRWSNSFENLDLALSHFSGTGREPLLQPTITTDGELVLTPHYAQVDQSGLELQLVADAWLWKLEAIRSSTNDDSFSAAAGGVEYTLVGLFESEADLGLIAEYLHDSRDEEPNTPFDQDIFFGTRWALNDVQSTELLAGIVWDTGRTTKLFTIEASRRLGDRITVSLEGRFFHDVEEAEALYSLRDDDHLQLELKWFF
jgi:hypothetical protein